MMVLSLSSCFCGDVVRANEAYTGQRFSFDETRENFRMSPLAHPPILVSCCSFYPFAPLILCPRNTYKKGEYQLPTLHYYSYTSPIYSLTVGSGCLHRSIHHVENSRAL